MQGNDLMSRLQASAAAAPSAAGDKRLIGTVGAAAAALLVTTVATWEGKRNDPYTDIVGVWTVCYGETQAQMRRYSDAECRGMLAARLVDYARPVIDRNPELAGHPYQLAAAVSLAYNIGPAAYRRSTVARRFSTGNWKGACDGFLAWSKAGGKAVRGLLRRRQAERAMCLEDL